MADAAAETRTRAIDRLRYESGMKIMGLVDRERATLGDVERILQEHDAAVARLAAGDG